MAASQISHGQIGKIIEDMEELLPSETIDRADYKKCRTTYGVLSTTYKRANDSNTPEKEYKELQELEKCLRHRLSNLDPTRGLPRKFQRPLDDLKAGIDGALENGVSVDFLIEGLKDVLNENPDATPAHKPEPNRLVPEKRLKKVLEELRNEKDKNRKLNEENNRITLELKQYKMREEANSYAEVRASKKSKKADILRTLSSDMPSILPLTKNARLGEIVFA